VRDRPLRPRQADRDEGDRDRADRKVQIEDPVPRQEIGDDAAEQRSGDRAAREHRAEHALIAAALARAEQIPDRDLRQRQQPAGAQSLHRPESDELVHGLRQAGEHRAQQEDSDRHIEQRLAAMLIAELAVERHRHGRGHDVGRHHPGQMRDRPEIADDARQGGGDDALIERAEGQDQDQSGEDRTDIRLLAGWFVRRRGPGSLVAHEPLGGG